MAGDICVVRVMNVDQDRVVGYDFMFELMKVGAEIVVEEEE